MTETEARPLHLHTLDSLISDLVSGRPIQTAAGELFSLQDDQSRSALNWYLEKGPSSWTANVTPVLGKELVDAVQKAPPELPSLATRPENANTRRLRLRKLEAHRFAGLHKFGTPENSPPNYIMEFASPLTLFEGRNGSGKTSLLNAIIWALTGDILRPQRNPENAVDFDCLVDAANAGDDQTTHKLSSLTPMPTVDQYRPNKDWIPTDTWVELTFTDEKGEDLPVVRRSQSRTPRGKLIESKPDLSVLKIDPIAVRVGTIMPALLPLIKVGSESELGRAVSQLTGLSALVDLAHHAKRTKNKINTDFIKEKERDRDRADHDYNTAKGDLEKILIAQPHLRPTKSVPAPSDDVEIEQTLLEISKHFKEAKETAFQSACDILGDKFDPTNFALLSDLEKNISGAIERASQPRVLVSAARLGGLRQLTIDQLSKVDAKIQTILDEAKALETLAQDPSTAARKRLYARVATWVADHPEHIGVDDNCLVCGGDLETAADPVTGKLVKLHLKSAASDAVLLSQTIGRWANNALGDLLRNLPEVLASETKTSLPTHPCDLLRKAIVDELFGFEPFRGVLGDLKSQTANKFDEVVRDCAPLSKANEFDLPEGCEDLQQCLVRLDCALRFVRWRQSNDVLAGEIVQKVLGRVPKENEPKEKTSLIGKLLDLQATVSAAQPITDAITQCDRLERQMVLRRAAQKRLDDYDRASVALANLMELGRLADEQVNQLRVVLRDKAATWRSNIYLGAFPDTAHELIDTGLGRKGELDLVVRTGGVSAPAQHVTNASALRASLVAFFLSFWEYVLKERGGLVTLLLDDPQELLDDENRERFATSLAPLISDGAQLIVTSYDARFCGLVSRLEVKGGVSHFEVHPATRQKPLVQTTTPLPAIKAKRAKFEADNNVEDAAREFANTCRIFLEAKLGDLFDDPAHATWTIENPNPTLSVFVDRLRPLVKAGSEGMFSANVFREFVHHSALSDGSNVTQLMNKAHHGRHDEIRAADVTQCADDLVSLLSMVERMHEECYRWRRRDRPEVTVQRDALPALKPMSQPALNVLVCPDLAAFTESGSAEETQDITETLHPSLLDSAAVFYLRRENFGFAAPSGALAIVEAVQCPAADRRLVIARHQSDIFARRVVRNANSEVIGLTADVLDPRTRCPKTIMLPGEEVAIHQVIGIIFDHSMEVGPGPEEAVLVDGANEFKRIEVAFRVIDDSAVPLALEKQVVLGGGRIELNQLGHYKGALVALTLENGSSIFKRVGASLPSELRHLRQFESIGGLGSSQVLSIGKPQNGFLNVINARLIVGVLYHG
jgi:hypothetical protein